MSEESCMEFQSMCWRASIGDAPRNPTRLKAILADRNSPQKDVWRAAIVLATADGFCTNEVMRLTATSKTLTLAGPTGETNH